MTSVKSAALTGLATLLLQANAYTLTAYRGPDCTGEVQQTIENTSDGQCQYFDDKASSIKVSGSEGAFVSQWVFFNNYPCSEDSQIGSFSGDGCMTQGATKLKAVNNGLPQGTKKRDVEKRKEAGTVRTWQNTDCSGNPTNEMRFVQENLRVTLNDVSSIKVSDVPDADVAFACSDSDCHVENQVATLDNDECVDVADKDVASAMVVGVPTPPKRSPPARRSLINEARSLGLARRAEGEGVECDTADGPDYTDALKVGDKWQGDNGMACCCHVPGGPSSRSDGSASASISDDIQCPGDPSGMPPSPTTCPLNCNSMRGYVYAIATKCKTEDGTTGGTYTLAGGGKVSLGHS